MRWLYHLLRPEDPLGNPYAPSSLAREGFIHASYLPDVAASARLYFAPGEVLVVLQIDPRSLDVPIRVADTPRGPMPHIHGPIPSAAIVARRSLEELHDAPDTIVP